MRNYPSHKQISFNFRETWYCVCFAGSAHVRFTGGCKACGSARVRRRGSVGDRTSDTEILVDFDSGNPVTPLFSLVFRGAESLRGRTLLVG